MLLFFTPRSLLKITIALAVVSIGLGVWGRACPAGGCTGWDAWTWIESLYRASALLLGEPLEVEEENLRLTLAYVAALCFILAGTGTLVLGASERAHASWIGLWSRIRPRHGHVVVLGLDRVGLHLLRDLGRGGGDGAGSSWGRRRRAIVVAPDVRGPDAEEARRLGALVLTGSPGAADLRRRARPHLAREVFVVTGDDAVSLDVAGDLLEDFRSGALRRPKRFRRTTERRRRRLQCYVHAGEPEFAQVLASHDLLGASELVDAHLFNVLDNAARDLLLHEDRGLARRYAPAADEVAQYLLFGFGAAGQTVALQMARLAHFRNRRRLRLTVLDAFGSDPEESAAVRRFRDRHPGFAPAPGFRLVPLLDGSSGADAWSSRDFRPGLAAWRFEDPGVVEYAVNAEFLDVPGEIDAPDLVDLLALRLAPGGGPPARAGIVVCFDDERRNFRSAFRLREALETFGHGSRDGRILPIYAYLPSEAGLARVLSPAEGGTGGLPLHAFGELRRCASYDAVTRPSVTALAGLIDRAYRNVVEKGPGASVEERPGALDVEQHLAPPDPALDPSNLYAALPAAFRASNEDAAAHADIKLDAIGYRRRRARETDRPEPVRAGAEQVELLAQIEHNRWMAERLVSGWRYGPRDDRRKRRPAFRPWECLDDANERAKDVSQVHALVLALNAAGEIVVRDGQR